MVLFNVYETLYSCQERNIPITDFFFNFFQKVVSSMESFTFLLSKLQMLNTLCHQVVLDLLSHSSLSALHYHVLKNLIKVFTKLIDVPLMFWNITLIHTAETGRVAILNMKKCSIIHYAKCYFIVLGVFFGKKNLCFLLMSCSVDTFTQHTL